MSIENGKTGIKTKNMVLTFASSILLEQVEVGYSKMSLRPDIANPRRCYKCQRCVHGSQSCWGRQTCAKRASHEHPAENCEGKHTAYSLVCPAWEKSQSTTSEAHSRQGAAPQRALAPAEATQSECEARRHHLQGGLHRRPWTDS